MRKKSPGRKSKAAKESALNDLFAELKEEYLESFPEKFAAIEKHWQERNRPALQNEFHKMKGTGTTYGLPEVSTIAEMLEDMCIHNSVSLGMSMVICLDLLRKISQNYKHNIPYELNKDPLYHQLQGLHHKMEQAS